MKKKVMLVVLAVVVILIGIGALNIILEGGSIPKTEKAFIDAFNKEGDGGFELRPLGDHVYQFQDNITHSTGQIYVQFSSENGKLSQVACTAVAPSKNAIMAYYVVHMFYPKLSDLDSTLVLSSIYEDSPIEKDGILFTYSDSLFTIDYP